MTRASETSQPASARAGVVTPETQASPAFRFALGTILVIAGVVCMIAGVRNLRHAVHPIEDTAMSEFLLGLVVLSFGAAIYGQPVASVRQWFLGAMAFTSMALLFDWVAFVPGPRAFNAGSSAAHPGAPVSSTVGRIAFGVGAIVFDLAALYAWRVAFRSLRTRAGGEQASDPGPA